MEIALITVSTELTVRLLLLLLLSLESSGASLCHITATKPHPSGLRLSTHNFEKKKFGGARRNRTDDLFNAIAQALDF